MPLVSAAQWAALSLCAATVVAAGCSPNDTTGSSTAPSPPASADTGSPTSAPDGEGDPTTAPATRYRPHPAEVDKALKIAAARRVERLDRVREVTFTQYFGYLPPSASILVEADFDDGGGSTYDVRLSRTGERWRADSIEAAEPVTADPRPSRLIRRVLENRRIDLPWRGREDVAAGRIAEPVLRSMLALSRQHRIGVSVLVSGHPENVFGTDRRSRHPDGFAYDLGSIDGHLVVDPEFRGLVRDAMRAAAATGASQVGGPEDLDGAGSQYFADATHSDHIHVGF